MNQTEQCKTSHSVTHVTFTKCARLNCKICPILCLELIYKIHAFSRYVYLYIRVYVRLCNIQYLDQRFFAIHNLEDCP